MYVLVTNIIAGLILLVCLAFLTYWFIAWRQGNCRFVLAREKRSPYTVEFMDFNRAVLTCTVPIVNEGKQNGTIMDAFVRSYLPREQYDRADVRALLMDTARPREDDYWEALIVEPGKTVELQVKLILTAKGGHILRELDDFPDMPMDIICQVVGRSDWAYEKSRIWLTQDDLRKALYNYTAGGTNHG